MSSFASSAWNRQFLASLLAVSQHEILWIPYGYAFHKLQMSHSHSKGSRIVVRRWYHLAVILIKQVNTSRDNKSDTLSFTLQSGKKEHYLRLYVKSINLHKRNKLDCLLKLIQMLVNLIIIWLNMNLGFFFLFCFAYLK